jgi:tetratricopeptide (TPR) repeat protein
VRAAERLLTEGAVDEAVSEYTRIADHLDREGFAQRAAALYKKILKIKPEDDNALWRLGNISAGLGLMLDARSQIHAVAQRRLERGDLTGAEAAQVRLRELDEAEVQVRLAGAQTQAEFGESSTAVHRLKAAAADLQQQGKGAEALALLTEAAMFNPADATLRQSLVDAYIAQGDFDTACQFATTGAELGRVADELFRAGREDEGLNVLATAVEVDPLDTEVRAALAKRLAARGDFDSVRDIVSAHAGEYDGDMRWALAEVDLRKGRRVEGLTRFRQILAAEPSRRDALVELGCAIAEAQTEDAFACIELAVDAASRAISPR